MVNFHPGACQHGFLCVYGGEFNIKYRFKGMVFLPRRMTKRRRINEEDGVGLFKANEVKIGPNGSFADTMNEVKRGYMRVDMMRMVKERGVKLNWPENHPRRSVLALRVLLYLTSEESPLKGSSEWQKVSMWKLVMALYEGYWQKSLDISSPDSLAHILTSLGYSHPLALISAANESEVIKEALTSRTQAAIEKGLFGVPSFFISTQPDRLIYGQDNLEQLEELLGGSSHLQKIIETFDLKRFHVPSLNHLAFPLVAPLFYDFLHGLLVSLHIFGLATNSIAFWSFEPSLRTCPSRSAIQRRWAT